METASASPAEMDDTPTDLAVVEWIRRGLKKEGKTQIGLARCLNIDPAAVNRMLKGRRHLRADEIKAVETYLEERFTVVAALPVRSEDAA